MAKFKSPSFTKQGDDAFSPVNEYTKYLTHMNEKRESFYSIAVEDF